MSAWHLMVWGVFNSVIAIKFRQSYLSQFSVVYYILDDAGGCWSGPRCRFLQHLLYKSDWDLCVVSLPCTPHKRAVVGKAVDWAQAPLWCKSAVTLLSTWLAELTVANYWHLGGWMPWVCVIEQLWVLLVFLAKRETPFSVV